MTRKPNPIHLLSDPDCDGVYRLNGWEIQETGAGDFHARIPDAEGNYLRDEYRETLTDAARYVAESKPAAVYREIEALALMGHAGRRRVPRSIDGVEVFDARDFRNMVAGALRSLQRGRDMLPGLFHDFAANPHPTPDVRECHRFMIRAAKSARRLHQEAMLLAWR